MVRNVNELHRCPLVATFLIAGVACASACGGNSTGANDVGPIGVPIAAVPGASDSPTGTAPAAVGLSPHAFGLGLQVEESYIVRRGNNLVAVPLEQVLTAAKSGCVVEFSRLSSGALAFGDLCVAAVSPSSLSGKVALLPCDDGNVMFMTTITGEVSLFSHVPGSNAPFLTTLDVSGCANLKGVDCVPVLNVDGNGTSAITSSPLSVDRSANGTLFHFGGNGNKCLIDDNGVPRLTTCNLSDASQRWFWTLPKLNNELSGIVSTTGQCLANVGSDTSPQLSLGACSSASAFRWNLNGPGITAVSGPPFRQAYLTGNLEDSSVSLSPDSEVEKIDNFSWQIGPDATPH